MANSDIEARLRLTATDATAAAFASSMRNMRGLTNEAALLESGVRGRLLGATSAARGLAGVLGGIGVGALLTKSYRDFAELEERIDRIGVAANTSIEETKKIKPAAEQLAHDLHVPFETVISGIEALVDEGNWSVKDAIAVMPTVIKAARVTGTAVTTVAAGVDGLLDTMGVKREELDKSFDVMLAGANRGGVKMKALLENLPKLATAAHDAGYEGNAGLATIIAVLQAIREHTNTDEEAFNGLQSILEGMHSGRVKQAFKDVGVDIEAVLDSAKQAGLDVPAVFVQAVKDHFGDSEEKLVAMFGKPLGRALAALFQEGSKEINDSISVMLGSTGKLEDAWSRFTGNAKNGLTDVGNALGELSNSVAELMAEARVPAWIDTMKDGVDAITQGIKGWKLLLEHPSEALTNLRDNTLGRPPVAPNTMGGAGVYFGGKSLEERDEAGLNARRRFRQAPSTMMTPGIVSQETLARERLADLNSELEETKRKLAAATDPAEQNRLKTEAINLAKEVVRVTRELEKMRAGIQKMSFDMPAEGGPRTYNAAWSGGGRRYGGMPGVQNASYTPQSAEGDYASDPAAGSFGAPAPQGGRSYRRDPTAAAFAHAARGGASPGKIEAMLGARQQPAEGYDNRKVARGGPGGAYSGGVGKNAQSWMNFLMNDMGLSKEKAAGVVAGLMGESGTKLRPDKEYWDVNGPSGGTAAWHDVQGRSGGRLTALKRFAAERGADWRDIGVQQQFFKHEMETTHAKAWRNIQAAGDERGALDSFVRYFEVPRNINSQVRARAAFLPKLMSGDVDLAGAPEEDRATRASRDFANQRSAAAASSAGQRTALAAARPPHDISATEAMLAPNDPRAQGGIGADAHAADASLAAFREARAELERPIRPKIETPELPSRFAPQFRRATARRLISREIREARWNSMADIGAA